jgi:hypothetical protein
LRRYLVSICNYCIAGCSVHPYAYDEDRLIDACARGRRRYDGFV